MPWSLYLFLFPCVLQVFLNFLELKRTKFWGKWFGIVGFILLSLGLAFLIVLSGGRESTVDRELAIHIYRITMGGGAILWLVDQLLWMRLRIKVI